MDYKDYQYSRDAPWRISIDCHATELPVRALAICQALGIPVRRTAHRRSRGPQRVALNGRPLILLAEGPSPERRRLPWRMSWAIILGHVGRVGCSTVSRLRRMIPWSRRPMCLQAGSWLRPACCGAAMCSLRRRSRSCAASAKRPRSSAGERLQLLYQRGKFLTSPSGAAGLRTVPAIHRRAQEVTHWGSGKPLPPFYISSFSSGSCPVSWRWRQTAHRSRFWSCGFHRCDRRRR